MRPAEVRDLHFGFDLFRAEIQPIDSDGDGIPDNLDPSCDNGAADDGDGGIDWNGGAMGEPPDPQCTYPSTSIESSACGLLGLEVLPLLAWSAWRVRRRRHA